MQEAVSVADAQEHARSREQRDWVEWYGGLEDAERREIRDRIVLASYEEVREDADLRQFFLFHVEDIVHEAPPGTRTLRELFHVVMTLRGRDDVAADRRKAVAFLLAEYQHYLRDNSFVS